MAQMNSTTQDKMEIVLSDGTVYPVQRYVGTVPVAQTVGDILMWLKEKGKFDGDASSYTFLNENGQRLGTPLNLKVSEYPHKRLVVTKSAPSSLSVTPESTPSTSPRPPGVPAIPPTLSSSANALAPPVKPSSRSSPTSVSPAGSRYTSPTPSPQSTSPRNSESRPQRPKVNAASDPRLSIAAEVMDAIKRGEMPPRQKKPRERVLQIGRSRATTVDDSVITTKSPRGQLTQQTSFSSLSIQHSGVTTKANRDAAASDYRKSVRVPLTSQGSGLWEPGNVQPGRARGSPVASGTSSLQSSTEATKPGFVLPSGLAMRNFDFEGKKRFEMNTFLFEIPSCSILFIEEQLSRGDTYKLVDAARRSRSREDMENSKGQAQGTSVIAETGIDKESQEFLCQLYDRLKDSSFGLETKSKKWVGSSKKYFTNSDLVDWLLRDDAKSRAEAVQLGEALQICQMIVPKNKNQMFNDDDNLSRFNSPEDFVFADSPAMQRMLVHLRRSSSRARKATVGASNSGKLHSESRSRRQTVKISEGSAHLAAGAVLSTVVAASGPPGSQVGGTVTANSTTNLVENNRGRVTAITDEVAHAARKRKSSPTRYVDFSVVTNIKVYEHELTFSYKKPYQGSDDALKFSVSMPWATVESIVTRSLQSATAKRPYIEIAAWDFRTLCFTTDTAASEDDLRSLVDRLTSVKKSFQDAQIESISVTDPSWIPFVTDPFLDLTHHPTLSSSIWKTVSPKSEIVGNIKGEIVPVTIAEHEIQRLSLGWIEVNTDGKLATLSKTLNTSELVRILDYVSTLQTALLEQAPKSMASSKIKVIDTGSPCGPLVEFLGSFFNFHFVNLPEIRKVEKIYATLKRVSSPFLKSFGPFFYQVENCGYFNLISTFLSATDLVIRALNEGTPVLVMEGRKDIRYSSIITSLVQVALDPAYRTPEGFVALFCKEWLRTERPLTNIEGPWLEVFIFLSCCAHLYHHNPGSFAFSEDFFSTLLNSVYSSGVHLEVNVIPNFVSSLASKPRSPHAPLEILAPLKLYHNAPLPWNHYLLQFNFGFLQRKESLRLDLSTVPSEPRPKFKSSNAIVLPDPPVTSFANFSLVSGNIWTLPPSFASLSLLTSLTLEGNRLMVVPSPILKLTSLLSLTLDKNRLRYLPDMRSLEHLEIFSAARNHLEDFEGICCVTTLSHLNLSSNRIKNVHLSLRNLTNLVKLDLADNEIVYVGGKMFSRMNSLNYLSLAGNEIVIPPTGLPSSLFELHLENNAITVLPSELFSCSYLDYLDLSGNHIEVLSEAIGNLKTLKYLALTQNLLDKLPPQLVKCRALEHLALGRNRFTEIPPWLYQIHSLRVLDLEFNAISKVTNTFAQFKGLRVLKLSHNLIDTIPFPLALLSETLEVLDLKGNPRLEAEVGHELERGTVSFLKFLKSKLSEELPVSRFNLLLVGPEKSGKSTLFSSLAHVWENQEVTNPKKRAYTDGLDVRSFNFEVIENKTLKLPVTTAKAQSMLKVKRVKEDVSPQSSQKMVESDSAVALSAAMKVKGMPQYWLDPKVLRTHIDLWDFSGREFYAPLNRHFYIRSAVYLLVVSLVDPNFERNLHLWFSKISFETPHPTVIIIGTHRDEVSKDVKPLGLLETAAKKLLESDPKSSLFVFTMNSSAEEELQALITLIQSVLVKLPDFIRKISGSICLLEHLIQGFADTLDYPLVSHQTFSRLADACGVGKLSTVNACLRYFGDNGIVMHFPESNHLKDVIFLDPVWLYSAMATIFGREGASLQSGLANNEAISRVFIRYDPKLHYHLRMLLVELKLGFEVEGNIPQLIELMQSATSKDPALEKTTGQTNLLENVQMIDSAATAMPRRRSIDFRRNSISYSPRGSPRQPSDRFTVKLDLNDEGTMVIASQLPSQLPVWYLKKHWRYPPKDVHYDRVFHFELLPPHIFPSIMVKLFKFAENLKKVWKDGVMGTFNVFQNIANVYFAQAYITPASLPIWDVDTKSPYSNAIRLEVRGTETSGAREVFLMLIDLVARTLIEERRLTYRSYVINPNSFKRPVTSLIPIDDIEAAVRRGETKFEQSENDSNLVFEKLCPDVALAFFSGPRVRMDQFSVLSDLGEGGFASIKKAAFQNHTVAVKMIKVADSAKTVTDKAMRRKVIEFRREVYAHSKLSHPNIVPLVAIVTDSLAFAIEYCKFGDLNKYIHRSDLPYSWAFVLKVATDIASALHYLHSQSPPWAHLDLKSPNILLRSNNPNDPICALVTDFGTCQCVAEKFTTRYVDNPTWLAPEILLGKPYDHRSDVYSYAVILWEMLTRSAFFGEIQWEGEKQDRIAAGDRPDIPSSCPEDYRKIIIACWSQEPSERPMTMKSVLDLLAHLRPSASKLDTTSPLPVPSPPKEDPKPAKDRSRSPTVGVLSPRHELVPKSSPTDLFPQIDYLVCWIDTSFDEASESSKIAMTLKKDNPKLAVFPFKTVTAFNEWFDLDGYKVAKRIRIVLASRKDEHIEKLAEKAMESLSADPRKSLLSIFVYLSTSSSSHLASLKSRGIAATHDLPELKRFIATSSLHASAKE